jgi:hypothetical protein
MFNGNGKITNFLFDDCTFTNCASGLCKFGNTTVAGSTFTFTNNTVNASAGHDGKENEWFNVTSDYVITLSGNTKDGADWAPGAAQGLGK